MIQLAKIEPKPDLEIVARLEELLARAKSGEDFGFLILTQDKSGITYNVAGVRDRYKVLGWLSHAMYKLQSDGPS